MKVSFITTVYNEEQTIDRFLDSLFAQTQLPDEIIIVDGGSTDATVSLIKKRKAVTLFIKKGNRSVGRNEASTHAKGKIIVCSDAGNVLDKNWIKQITLPLKDPSIAVVAGNCAGLAKSIFQKCLIPYVLIMPDKIDPQTFLPATRSIAFRKTIWEKVGKFDEQYSHNEDYVFAKKLQKIGAKIFFQHSAIVYWLPRENFREAFIMFFRFAYGDAESMIIRPKVIVLFARYLVAFTLLLFAFFLKSSLLFSLLVLLGSIYILWSIQKNYRYVNDFRALYLLPLLQFCADVGVMRGTVFGLFKHFFKS